MSLFNFEEAFSKTIKESKVNGYREFYKNPFTEDIECYINQDGKVFDLNHNMVEDQNRYKEMIESCTLVKADRLEMSKPLLAELGYI